VRGYENLTEHGQTKKDKQIQNLDISKIPADEVNKRILYRYQSIVLHFCPSNILVKSCRNLNIRMICLQKQKFYKSNENLSGFYTYHLIGYTVCSMAFISYLNTFLLIVTQTPGP